MWQDNLEFLDIITVLSFAMQMQQGEENRRMKEQLDRIERKIDILLPKSASGAIG